MTMGVMGFCCHCGEPIMAHHVIQSCPCCHDDLCYLCYKAHIEWCHKRHEDKNNEA